MPLTTQKHSLILHNSKSLEIRSPEIYISGPITGMPDLNRPAFSAASKTLNEKGYVPINPLNFFTEEEQKSLTWDAAMRSDIKHLLPCGACIMLPGWQNSAGATFEFITAKTFNIPVINADFHLLTCYVEDLRFIFERIIKKIKEVESNQAAALK